MHSFIYDSPQSPSQYRRRADSDPMPFHPMPSTVWNSCSPLMVRLGCAVLCPAVPLRIPSCFWSFPAVVGWLNNLRLLFSYISSGKRTLTCVCVYTQTAYRIWYGREVPHMFFFSSLVSFRFDSLPRECIILNRTEQTQIQTQTKTIPFSYVGLLQRQSFSKNTFSIQRFPFEGNTVCI